MSTITTIISNISLCGGMGFFVYGFYLRRKQLLFDNLFEEVKKAPKYHLDYVEKVESLPTDKNVLLFGTARTVTQHKIITKSYIKKTQDEDRLWYFKLKDKFNLATCANQLVLIEPKTEENVLAFNLHKNNQNQKLEQRVIHHNQPLAVFGNIQKNGQNSRKLIPTIVMGSKQQQILLFLDQQILRYSNMRKNYILLGTSILIGHFIYQLIWGQKTLYSQSNIKILQQIQAKP